MAIKGLLFDLYGTLIDIRTDESREDIYRTIAHYLTYHGIYLHRWAVRDRYDALVKRQKEGRKEKYPEIDVEALWNGFLMAEGMQSATERRKLSTVLAQLYRAISRKRLRLFPDVKKVLDELRPAYRLALVSDAQPCYLLPEVKAVGLDGYFDPLIISAPFGFRKPDGRLIGKALDLMNLSAAEAIFIGNDLFRDIYGAQRLGIRTIFVDSDQGEKSCENVSPDYIARHFRDVLQGVESLSRMTDLEGYF